MRRATAADYVALADVYRDAVTAMGPAAYTPGQIAGWAGFADEAGFEPWLSEAQVLVLDDDRGPVAFAGLGPGGHVSALYTAPRGGGRGYASSLLQALIALSEARGDRAMHTEASVFSRHRFATAGFRVVANETVARGGSTYLRWRMRRLNQ